MAITSVASYGIAGDRSNLSKKSSKFTNQNYLTKNKKFNNCSLSDSFLVFEESSRIILEERNPSAQIYPASLVKLMTLYLTFEAITKNKISFEQMIEISQRAQEISFVNSVNTLRLSAGSKISVKNAIEAVIVKSFNEAAVALAEAVAHDEWNFVRLMNKKAIALGMHNSSFRNSSGLHEEGQYSTAHDLAKLTYAIKRDFPKFYHLFARKNFSFRRQQFETHNEILKEFKGAEGMKTGFTKASGFNLISSAERRGERIFAVLVGCESSIKRNNMMFSLLELGFYKLRNDNNAEKEYDRKKISRLDLTNPYEINYPEDKKHLQEKIMF